MMDDKTGEICNMYGRPKMSTEYWQKNQKGRDFLEDNGLGGGDNININLKEIRPEIADWIHLTQDMEQWAGSC